MNIKNVIILGAGASKSEGAPLQNELLEEFFKYCKLENSKSFEGYPKGKEKWERLAEYFKNFWGINIKIKDQNNIHGQKNEDTQNQNVEFPTFEECLGVLDLAYHRGESFKGYSKNDIEQIRNDLIFLIAKVLDEKLKNKSTHHKMLIDRLKKEKSLKKLLF